MKVFLIFGFLSILVLFVLWTMLVAASKADDKIEEEYHHKY